MWVLKVVKHSKSRIQTPDYHGTFTISIHFIFGFMRHRATLTGMNSAPPPTLYPAVFKHAEMLDLDVNTKEC